MCMNIYVCTLDDEKNEAARINSFRSSVGQIRRKQQRRPDEKIEKIYFRLSSKKGSKLYRGRTRPKFIIFLWVKVIECTHIRVRPIDTNYRRLIISFDKSIKRVSSSFRSTIIVHNELRSLQLAA